MLLNDLLLLLSSKRGQGKVSSCVVLKYAVTYVCKKKSLRCYWVIFFFCHYYQVDIKESPNVRTLSPLA